MARAHLTTERTRTKLLKQDKVSTQTTEGVPRSLKNPCKREKYSTFLLACYT